MSYKIIADSCCEFPREYEKDERYQNVPLELMVEEEVIVDDETFDQADFLKKVAASPKCPKSACPSPEKYMEAYRTEAENVFVFTLSSKLSGSYNSAELGKKLYLEKFGKKNIYVCDSQSASCGETQLAMKAAQWSEEGLPFEEICRKLSQYRDHMNTYFVLDNLETLRKNGRLSGVKALVASTLSIKPVMGAVEGVIIKEDQARGVNKALTKMCDYAQKNIKDPEGKTAVVAHCNNRERAEFVKEEVKKLLKVKDIIITETNGVSTLYAAQGGIIMVI